MYIALKDLRLSGVRYIAGDMIKEEAVVPNRAAALIRSGYIAKQEDKNRCDETGMNNAKGILIHLQKSGEDVLLDPDEAAAIFTILQENAEEAASFLAEQTSRNVLALIREVDGRKSVRAAAESFLTELRED